MTQALIDQLFTGDHLDAMTFPELEYLVNGVITEGLGVLAGPPKAGKSWMVGNVALACASGGRALGKIHVTQRPVLYLALEDSERRLQTRLRKLSGGEPLPARLSMFNTPVQFDDALDLIDTWLSINTEERPLVIVDTFGKIKPTRAGNAEPYQADYKAASALKEITDRHPGSGILLVHHTRKVKAEGGGDFLEDLSGTQGIAGAADYVLVLRRPRNSIDGTLHVTGRDVEESAYAMTFHDCDWTLVGADLADAAAAVERREERGQVGDRLYEVVTFVNGREKTTARDVAAWFEMDGDMAGKYLRRAADRSSVRKIGRGEYGPPLASGEFGGEVS